MSIYCLLGIVSAWPLVVSATNTRFSLAQNVMLPDWTWEFEKHPAANEWMGNFVTLISNRKISKLKELSELLANMQRLEAHDTVQAMFREGRQRPSSTSFNRYLDFDTSVKAQDPLWPSQKADGISALLLKSYDHESIGCKKADIENMRKFSDNFSNFANLSWILSNNLTTHILMCYQKYRNAFLHIIKLFGHIELEKHAKISNFSALRDMRKYRLASNIKETYDKYVPEIVQIILNEIESPKSYNVEFSTLISVPSNYREVIGARFDKLIKEPCKEMNFFSNLVKDYVEFVSVSGERSDNPVYRELATITDRFNFCIQAMTSSLVDNLINRYYTKYKAWSRGNPAS